MKATDLTAAKTRVLDDFGKRLEEISIAVALEEKKYSDLVEAFARKQLESELLDLEIAARMEFLRRLFNQSREETLN